MTDNPTYNPDEFLICAVARLLEDSRHVAIGMASPVAGSAALMLREETKNTNDALRVSMIGGDANNPFTDGGRELFDCAGQGRIDTFFLGGVQIDGQANINLVGVGEYPALKKRFPGSFGSALMYYVVPKVILFREEHSPRTLVEKVDFVSAPGVSAPEVHRPGGPHALVTGRAVFDWIKDAGRFRLKSVHEGETVDGIREMTGFDFDVADDVHETPAPSPERMERIRRDIAPKILTFYPEFAGRVWGLAA